VGGREAEGEGDGDGAGDDEQAETLHGDFLLETCRRNWG
jgi:hypothetical protein